MTKYPIGIQNFQKLRESGFLYVYKTAFVHQLVSTEGYYFLSRPRRFGKSLLISTLEAYYQGKKELFKGLALEQLEKDWTVHPVFHIDLNVGRYNTPEALFERLDHHLKGWENAYGIQHESTQSLGTRFEIAIKQAYEQSRQKVVILVDEYDKPLLQALGNKALQDEYRAMLKSVYGVVKSMDGYIQMAFFTGVTKFSKVSVFSDLNNLKDISLNPKYAEICGITEKEIHEHFDEEVAQMAEANDLTKDECYAKLKENYDGYHFSGKSVGVYNPFSLLNAFCDQTFNDYWFKTGTPTFLVETLKHNNYELENMTREKIEEIAFVFESNLFDDNPLSLLYQFGYLTIKSYDQYFMGFQLKVPNSEAEHGLMEICQAIRA